MNEPTPTPLPEQLADKQAVPVWLFILLLMLIWAGMVYFDQHGGWFSQEVYAPYRSIAQVDAWQPRREGPDLALGRKKFEDICALCHGTDGQGKPGQAPPLAKSEFALANPNRVIPIPLVGLVGRITVVGQVWDAQMLAMGATLSDEELSAVLTYIRKSWGNNGSEINAAQLKEVRTELTNHPQITPEQLNARPEK